jgi:CubicO group peptidase (beta-lactamase class C family)
MQLKQARASWRPASAASSAVGAGILSEDAFGHPGFGGSIGFADPRARMSFGYTMS